MRKKFIYTLWVLVVLGILAVAMVFTAIAKGWIGYVPPVEECASGRRTGKSELEVCHSNHIR